MADGDEDVSEVTDSEQVPDEDDETVMLDAFDLDHDGKVSIIEDARARLGIIDASLEEQAKQPGLKGTIADVAHRAVDKLDND